MLHDRDHDDELGRQQEDRGDQEDVRRVVGLVPRSLDERDLGDGRADGEEHERQPDRGVVLLALKPRSEGQRDQDGDDRDRNEVRGRREREPAPARAGIRALAELELGGYRAHGRLAIGRWCRMSSLS